MSAHPTTCWEVVDGAAQGAPEMRAEFVRRYTDFVRTYLGARWRGTPLAEQVDDVAHDVFVECFRRNGVLDRVDSRRGSFRAFLCGAIRNVARRVEATRAAAREIQPTSGFDVGDQPGSELSGSRILDRAWARTMLNLAGDRMRREAESDGDSALRRIEILRLRFESGMPIREIARLWKTDPARVHEEFRQARQEFRCCFEAELAQQAPESAAGDKTQLNELLAMLG